MEQHKTFYLFKLFLRKFFLLLLIPILLFSCSTDVEEEGSDINSDILVSITEELGTTGNVLKIKSETIKIYPCINYNLLTDYNFDGEDLQVSYQGVDISNICFTALGPATSEKVLTIEPGSYPVQFGNEEDVTSGTLQVDEEKYILELNSSSTIFLAREVLYKIPHNTYWGIIGYRDPSTESLLNVFEETLTSENVDFRSFTNGDYGHFKIANNEIVPPDNHGYYFADAFVFEFTGSLEELRQKVSGFLGAQGADLSVSIYSYNGNEIRL